MKIIPVMIVLFGFSALGFTAENDYYSCESTKKDERDVPLASLLVYHSKRVQAHKLIVRTKDNQTDSFVCDKEEGSTNGANYAVYTCSNSLYQTQAILSIDKDHLDATFDMQLNEVASDDMSGKQPSQEKDDVSYDMLCRLNDIKDKAQVEAEKTK